MKKRLLSILLALSMVLTFLPLNAVTAFAEDDGTIEMRGTTDTGAAWVLVPNEDDSTYTIVFSGEHKATGGLTPAPKDEWREAITKAVLNEGITEITGSMFSSLPNLTSVVVPASLNNIADYAFSGCSKLEEITTSALSPYDAAAGTIGTNAFLNCTKLKTAELPNFVDSIDGSITNRFSGCGSLEKLYLYGKNGKIGDGCINYFQKSLKDFRTRQAITEIGERAFSGCSKLETIFLSPGSYNGNYLDQVEIIGQQAFKDCTGLKNLRIHYSVKSIGYKAFENSGLTSITLEGYNNSVESYAFSGCKDLKDVKILNNVKSIQADAFDDCPQLTGFEYSGTEEEWNERVNSKRYDVDLSTRADVTTKFAHTVTYKDGDNTVDTDTAQYGSSGVIGKKPTKAGYTLKGWEYTDSNGDQFTVAANGKVANVIENLTLYAVWLKNVVVPDNVTITAGGEPVSADSNKMIKVDPDTKITLTVNDPKYRDTYKWSVNGNEDTDHVSEDGKSFTIEAGNTLDKIGLEVTEHDTYDVDDFTVTGLKDYAYGDTVEVKVTPKNEESVTGYTVAYVKNAGTDQEVVSEELPTEAGTYTVRITKGETVINVPGNFTIKPRTDSVTIKGGVLQKVVKEEEDITAEITKDDDGNFIIPEGALVTVTFDKDFFADSHLKFSYWDIDGLEDPNAYYNKESFTFTMPGNAVTLEAMPQDDSIDDAVAEVLGNTAIVGTAILGGAALGITGYMLGTEMYLICLLPIGTPIPSNAAQLAELVWTDAGKPAPAAVLPEDASEDQQAMAWAVEEELISADKAPDASVSRIEVIKTWKKAQSVKAE